MALNTVVTEAQISELHRLTRELSAKITGLVASIPPTDGLYNGFQSINADLVTMIDQLRKAEARIVYERLLVAKAALQAQIDAQQVIIQS